MAPAMMGLCQNLYDHNLQRHRYSLIPAALKFVTENCRWLGRWLWSYSDFQSSRRPPLQLSDRSASYNMNAALALNLSKITSTALHGHRSIVGVWMWRPHRPSSIMDYIVSLISPTLQGRGGVERKSSSTGVLRPCPCKQSVSEVEARTGMPPLTWKVWPGLKPEHLGMVEPHWALWHPVDGCGAKPAGTPCPDAEKAPKRKRRGCSTPSLNSPSP